MQREDQNTSCFCQQNKILGKQTSENTCHVTMVWSCLLVCQTFLFWLWPVLWREDIDGVRYLCFESVHAGTAGSCGRSVMSALPARVDRVKLCRSSTHAFSPPHPRSSKLTPEKRLKQYGKLHSAGLVKGVV